MKRLLILLVTLMMLGACSKVVPCKEVKVNFFESEVTVQFTNGTQTYVFTEADNVKLLPIGQYQICVLWNGGCGGLRLVKATQNGEENVLLVGPEGGNECIVNQTLASEYYASVNCE